jgi:hypothetical protein
MLIGFHGRKQAGKDTAYQRLTELFMHGSAHPVSVERVSFADLLYRSAAAALGVTVEELYRWKVDDTVRIAIQQWTDYGEGVWKTLHTLNFRQYLQYYGTEAHRDIFGSDFWVDAVDLRHDPHHFGASRFLVVTDVRFVNEAEAIREYGGVIVELVGPTEVEQAGDTHASETPLPRELVDFVIDNSDRSDSFEALDNQLRSLVAELRRGEP